MHSRSGHIKVYQHTYFLIIVILSFFSKNALAEIDNKLLSGVSTGISEKGNYIELFSNINNSDQIGLGINYLNTEALGIETGLYGNDSFNNFGISLNFRRFFLKKKKRSSLYYQLSGEYTSFSFLTKIDLEKESYQVDALTFSCSACGNLIIETEPDQIIFIPSFLVGYQYRLNHSFALHMSLGAQYLKNPKLQWSTDNSYEYPDYVSDQIDIWVDDAQDLVDSISSILPTAKIGISYLF